MIVDCGATGVLIAGEGCVHNSLMLAEDGGESVRPEIALLHHVLLTKLQVHAPERLDVQRRGAGGDQRLVKLGLGFGPEPHERGDVALGLEQVGRLPGQVGRLPVEPELGGKDAMIICADANLERAARAAMWGGLVNCGQMCTSVERIFVEEPAAEAFMEREELPADSTLPRPGARIEAFVVRADQGGIRLARDPADINVGELVRKVEPDFHVVECFDSARNTCQITRVCTLIAPLHEAREAFLQVLDRYTVADLFGPKRQAKYQRVFLQLVHG